MRKSVVFFQLYINQWQQTWLFTKWKLKILFVFLVISLNQLAFSDAKSNFRQLKKVKKNNGMDTYI